MAITRPSGSPVVTDPIVAQEVAEIDGRGRLHLLPRWTKRIKWWATTPKDDFSVLMVLVEPGLISLRDWASDGTRVIARYEELAAQPSADVLEALRLLQDRYIRLSIDKEQRAHLGDAAFAHLGLPITRGAASTVYVAVFSNRLDILSAGYRNSKLITGSSLLDDLP
jgi:hypothetical protein